MKNILVEGQYGHGAIHKHKVFHTLKRLGRENVGKSPIPFDWSKPIPFPNDPIKNQGKSSSCGRQAGSYVQRIILRRLGIDEGELSAKSGYGRYCYLGGGMTVDAVETAVCSYGTNLEKDVPSYDANGNPLSESMMEERSYETPQTMWDALKRAGFTPYNVAINKEAMAQAIRDYGAIIILIRGQNGNQPNNWLTRKPSPPVKANKDPLWAHYMAGVATTTNEIGFFQSWGENVGENGHQFFDETYINSGYIVDCIAFVHDSQISSLPSSMPIYQGLLQWFKSRFVTT